MSAAVTPQLLVSVRDIQEAAAAVDGGADIVDVKEPSSGPLGYAGADMVERITNCVAGRLPVSAALGECVDWLTPDAPPPLSSAVSEQLAWVKLGPARLIQNDDWTGVWQQALAAALPSTSRPRWVAVAYADYERAGSPEPEDMLQAAIARDCAALLLDTFVKDGRTTFDWLTEARLAALRQQAADSGLLFALAGQISVGHTPAIRDLQPDIVAVRGAVCDQSDRGRTVCQDRVRSLKAVLEDAVSGNARCSRV